jgi:hypothetical protein
MITGLEKWMRLKRNAGEMWEGGKDMKIYEGWC